MKGNVVRSDSRIGISFFNTTTEEKERVIKAIDFDVKNDASISILFNLKSNLK